MKLMIVHRTTYRYSQPVTLAHNQARLIPRDTSWQRRVQSRLSIEPFPTTLSNWTDYFGNEASYFTLEEPHLDLSIALHATVEMSARSFTQLEQHDSVWEAAVDAFRHDHAPESVEAALFCYDSPYVKRAEDVRAYAASSFTPGRGLYAAVRELTARINADFRYDSRATSLTTTTSELLQLRRGVCQDFAHLQLACLRSMGLAARYVSGYLVTRPPPGRQKLVGADASHAWIAVYFPQVGWIDFDPTNNCVPDQDHVTLAWGRDYFDVAPIKGLYLGEGPSVLNVEVDVSEMA